MWMAGSLENGDVAHLNEVERRQRELQGKQQQLLREQRTADQEKLLSCITGATPVACSVLLAREHLAFTVAVSTVHQC